MDLISKYEKHCLLQDGRTGKVVSQKEVLGSSPPQKSTLQGKKEKNKFPASTGPAAGRALESILATLLA